MGNSTVVERKAITLMPDVDSVAEPGKKCIRSSSFSHLDPPITLDQVVETAMYFLRYPIWNGMPDYEFLKRVEVQEFAENDFEVKVILDGEKLDAAGKGQGDGMDQISLWRRTILTRIRISGPGSLTSDWDTRITQMHYVRPYVGIREDEASNDDIKTLTVFYCMPRSVVCEVCVDVEGVRDASGARCERIEKIMNLCYQDWCLHWIVRVRVTHGHRSIKDPGKISNVSEVIDDHCTYDELWENLMRRIKRSIGCDSDGEDGQYVGVSHRPEIHHDKVRSELEASKATGEVRLLQVAITEDGALAWPSWSRLVKMVVHQEPLAVESWEVDEDGDNVSNFAGARRLSELVNSALERISDSWSPGWAV